MKRIKNLSMVMLLSVFMLSAGMIKAQKGNQAMMGKQKAVENRIPDLTDKQKEEIKILKTAYLKEVQQIKAQMDIKRAELKALQTVENPDLDAINKKIEERSALRTDLEKRTAAHRQAIRALLTDDQKVVFDQKMMRHGKAHSCSHDCGHDSGKQCKGNRAGHACKK